MHNPTPEKNAAGESDIVSAGLPLTISRMNMARASAGTKPKAMSRRADQFTLPRKDHCIGIFSAPGERPVSRGGERGYGGENKNARRHGSSLFSAKNILRMSADSVSFKPE